MGSVYYGVRRSDQLPVALKFFGYTHRAPSEESIREEIRVMMALRNVDGVVHLHGTFLDSATGYIEGKRFPIPCPVLVMDFLEGFHPPPHSLILTHASKVGIFVIESCRCQQFRKVI
jgi:serine/threonine protein kinase